jgi:hypothetical protein
MIQRIMKYTSTAHVEQIKYNANVNAITWQVGFRKWGQFPLVFIPYATSGNKLASLDFHTFYNLRDAFLEEVGANWDLLWEKL